MAGDITISVGALIGILGLAGSIGVVVFYSGKLSARVDSLERKWAELQRSIDDIRHSLHIGITP